MLAPKSMVGRLPAENAVLAVRMVKGTAAAPCTTVAGEQETRVGVAVGVTVNAAGAAAISPSVVAVTE